MNFTKKMKQQIIDDYMAATGRNMYVPGEFVSWLSGQPEHPAYAVFFSISDEEAAHKHREHMAREWASGLRFVVKSIEVQPASKMAFTVQAPLMISPISQRKNGGGYVYFDTNDDDHMASFRKEAADALAAFVRRYELALVNSGVNVDNLRDAIEALQSEHMEELQYDAQAHEQS